MKTHLIASAIALSGFLVFSVYAQEGGMPIRHSAPMKGGQGLGTRGYVSLDDETPFLKRITEKPISLWAHVQVPKPSNVSEVEWKKIQEDQKEEEKKRIPVADYALAKQIGEYVGWFGIVRAVKFDEDAKETTILVEHKYFDGLTDLHMHIVSIFGAGDFEVVIPGGISPKEIPELSLICAYGTVKNGGGLIPRLNTEYVRVWQWGLFTFMDYGQDKSNPAWKRLRKVSPEDAYDPSPSREFYEDRLGKR